MAKCAICEKAAHFGNNVSHSHRITDGMVLQRGGAWFTSWGAAVIHSLPSSAGTAYNTTVDVHKTTTVWIDYNNW